MPSISAGFPVTTEEPLDCTAAVSSASGFHSTQSHEIEVITEEQLDREAMRRVAPVSSASDFQSIQPFEIG